MTTPRTKEHPEAGARIRARRAYLNLSRPQVAALSNNVLYVELQKRIEDGNKRVLTLRADQVRAYLDALQWTTEDYERETGVELPDSPGVPGAEPYEGGLNVGYYGTVAAGVQGDTGEGEGAALAVARPEADGGDPVGVAGARSERDSAVVGAVDSGHVVDLHGRVGGAGGGRAVA